MKPIYAPKGKAKEYGDLAINIYTGCPHRCFYCYAPNVLHIDRERFHTNVAPRDGIVEATIQQLEKEHIAGKTIHLCFTCDPYPTGYDTTPTREIIKAIKAAGNHVQILTKGDGTRDFDLLDREDWYGITFDGINDAVYSPYKRLMDVSVARDYKIKTWCSFEPVIDTNEVIDCIRSCYTIFDRVKIGKLSYHRSDINWAKFGREVEELCQSLGLDYYIKESLRKEMEAHHDE